MSSGFPECEQFINVRSYYLNCRGERLTPLKCARWRFSRGLDPRFADIERDQPTGVRWSKSVATKRRGSRLVGPGTEFRLLIDSLKVPAPEGCNCEALRVEMDVLGVEGCRRERERLIAAIRENSAKVSWLGKIAAIGAAISTGLAFTVNPLDPVPGLFDEAVRRAEAAHNAKVRPARPPRSVGARKSAKCGGCGAPRQPMQRPGRHAQYSPPQSKWPEPQPIEFSDWHSEAEASAIRRMVAPNMPRHVWRGGILQIWVTRACDKACFGCTQGSNLAGRPGMITPEQFETACRSLKDYPGVIGMFGGNPCIHPQFDELCQILRSHIPYEQRGLWCNNLLRKGAFARITFNPAVSNLNVHLDRPAYDEFVATWPEAAPYLKGLDQDSRHSPPYVAMEDLLPDEAQRWELIGGCDINQNWSAMICIVRGELRGFFCEIAGAQAMLHQDNPNWRETGAPMPDTGHVVVPGWWNQPMTAFIEQARLHCHACGIPLRGFGGLACSGDAEQFSRTHEFVARTKRRDVGVQLVHIPSELSVPRVTDYIENGVL